jgi:arylsulfatase A-like enzyme
MSDNGMSWGQKGYPQKHVPTASRLPFYIAGPGVAPGATVGALSTNLDIAPTIAEMSGVPLGPLEGRSLLGLAGDPSGPGYDEILEVMPSDGSVSPDFFGWEAIRTPDWRLIRWETGKRELFRVAVDPWELADLAGVRPDVVADLEPRLDALLQASQG